MSEAKCPFANYPPTRQGALSNKDWWPDNLNLGMLSQHSAKSNPMDADFDYASEFKKLDYFGVKKDIEAIMTDSKSW